MGREDVVSEKEKRNLRNWPLCIPGTGRFPLQTAPWLDLPVMCMTKQKTNELIKVPNSSSDSNTTLQPGSAEPQLDDNLAFQCRQCRDS